MDAFMHISITFSRLGLVITVPKSVRSIQLGGLWPVTYFW